MTFEDYKIDGDNITLNKKELEEARNHFCEIADKFKPKKNGKIDLRYGLYLGKADLLNDILKMFDDLDSAL